MSQRLRGWVLILGGFAWAAWAAPDGRRLVSQADIPLTITNAGSYLVTENLTVRNGVLIPAASLWKYRDDGSNQGTAWRAIGFDETTWPAGRAELGYGDNGVEATIVSYGPDAGSKYITTYFRRAFLLTNAAAYTDLDLYVRRDDGVVVYLNGTEVARDNMPGGTITYTTLASEEVPDATGGSDLEARYGSFDIPHGLLVNGTNVVAVEVHLAAGDTDDMSFDLVLFGDVAGASGTPVNGITIAADNVTLDLNGHTLTGVEFGSIDGIQVAWGRNVTLRNGTVTEWGDDGIDALNTTNCRIENIRAVRNSYTGIQGGTACLIRNCVAYGNGMTRTAWESGDGIMTEEGSIVHGCIVRQNYNHAIVAGSSSDIANCVVTRNGHDGLHAGQGAVVSRFIAASSILTAANGRGDGLEVNLACVVTDSSGYRMDDGMKTREDTTLDGRALFLRCTAYSNYNDGIKSQDGALISQCTSAYNADDGFNVQNGCVVIGNTSCGNGFFAGGTAGGGVTIEGVRNRVQDNHLMGNENGIRADGGSGTHPQYNVIVRNSAGGNLEDYRILSANNVAGPATNVPDAAPAWANFDF